MKQEQETEFTQPDLEVSESLDNHYLQGIHMGECREVQAVPNGVAAKYAVHAMLSSNSYHQEDRVRFPVEMLGWYQVDLDGAITCEPTQDYPVPGLAYDIYEKNGTNEVIFAFRGSDGDKECPWGNFSAPPFNFQYRQARKEFGRYLNSHGNKNIAVAGHSLGGCLALNVSVHYGVQVVAFDPSPRVFVASGDFHGPAVRVIMFAEGERLDVVRSIWRTDNDVIELKNVYRCSYDFPDRINRRRSDYLALGILQQGAISDPNLRAVLDSLPPAAF